MNIEDRMVKNAKKRKQIFVSSFNTKREYMLYKFFRNILRSPLYTLVVAFSEYHLVQSITQLF